MRVTLLHPAAESHLQTHRNGNGHLGLGYLAAYLRQKGHVVRILDAKNDCVTNEVLRHHVLEFRPEIFGVTAEMMEVLKDVMQPDGFNLGANLGRVAGAGIDKHIHFHIVPRWNGDSNFMPTLADTKVVSESMQSTYKRIMRSLAKGKRQKAKRKKSKAKE